MSHSLRAFMRTCRSLLADHAAHAYAAGPELADALPICRGLNQRGIASTLCFWNGDDDLPRAVADTCRDARAALWRLRDAGASCELELMFGLPMGRVVRVAHEMDVPVRIYVPYGQAWLPYRLSLIRQQPRVAWWLARDLLLGRVVGRARLARLSARRGAAIVQRFGPRRAAANVRGKETESCTFRLGRG